MSMSRFAIATFASLLSMNAVAFAQTPPATPSIPAPGAGAPATAPRPATPAPTTTAPAPTLPSAGTVPRAPAPAGASVPVAIAPSFAADVSADMARRAALCAGKGPGWVWRPNVNFGKMRPTGGLSTSVGTCRQRGVTASEMAAAGIDAATIQRILGADRR